VGRFSEALANGDEKLDTSTEELVEGGAISDESREFTDPAFTIEREVLDPVLIEDLVGPLVMVMNERNDVNVISHNAPQLDIERRGAGLPPNSLEEVEDSVDPFLDAGELATPGDRPNNVFREQIARLIHGSVLQDLINVPAPRNVRMFDHGAPFRRRQP
jgi:hypothetical protein